MAERASDENTEPDVTSRRSRRRSSILKPARPILESVDSNVTEDLTERRRLYKRVSFSETHQIKLFKTELSGEQSSSCENALEAGSATTAGNKTLLGNAAEHLVGEAVQLLQYDHTPLEQSFYHGADNSDAEAASPTTRASVLMEEAQSCLVFAQHGDITVASEGAASQFGLNTTLALRTMDITCVGTRTVDQTTTTQLTNTMLVDRGMEMTFAGNPAHNQAAATLLKAFVDKGADRTLASTSALHQGAGNLSRTNIFSTKGDITVGPQNIAEFGGDATVQLQDTMNITCAVGSTSFARGAANDTDIGAVKCAGQGTVLGGAIPTPAVACTGNVSRTAALFDLSAFVASSRRNDVSDIMGKDDVCVTEASCTQSGPSDQAPGSSNTGYRGMKSVKKETGSVGAVCSASNISNTAGQFDLAAFVASGRRNDVCKIMGTQSDPSAPSGATCSNTSDVGVGHVRETACRGLSPVETLAVTDYLAATTNIAGLDVTAGPPLASFAQLPNADLSSASGARPNARAPVSLASGECRTESQMLHNSQAMMPTWGQKHLQSRNSPPGAIGRSRHLNTNPVGATGLGTNVDDSEDLAQHAEAQSRTTCGGKDFDDQKTSLLPSAMNMTCASSAVPTPHDASVTSAPVVSQQLETLTSVFPGVMNMTCTDRVVSARVACSGTRLSCANPASMTLHYDNANLTGAMNMTCRSTTRCPLLVADTTDLNVEPNGQLNEAHTPHAVSGRTRWDINEHSLDQASSHFPLVALNVVAPDAGAPGDRNLDGAAEDSHESVASLNATVGNKNSMNSCRSLAFLRVPASAEVGIAASVAEFTDAVPQDLPVRSEMTAPLLLKAAPADKPTDKLSHVECATSSTAPLRPTPLKGSTNVSMRGSESKCLNARALPVNVLTGKDSIAYQHLASPIAKRSDKEVLGPTRMASGMPLSMSKSWNAASKVNLTAATEMFNSLTDSAVNLSNVTAQLEMPSEYVSSLSLLADVFSPERVAKENPEARHVGTSASKRLTKAQQQPSASHSHLATDRGQHSTDNGNIEANLDKISAPDGGAQRDQAVAGLSSSKKSLPVTATSADISEVNLEPVAKHLDTAFEKNTVEALTTIADRCPQPNTICSPVSGLNATFAPGTQSVGASLSACPRNIEPARKSATFLVSSAKNARPSATFAVLSPACRVICIDNSTTVDQGNGDASLVPKDPRLSAARRLLGKEPAATADELDNSRSAALSRSRKKLEFTEIRPRPPQNGTGSTCSGCIADSCREDACRNMPTVSVSSTQCSDMSRCRTCPDYVASSRKLHGTSSASLTVFQRSTGGRSNDLEMLMDIPEPSLVTTSPPTSSVDNLQHSRSNEVAVQPVSCVEVGELPSEAALASGTGVCIPASMFYSSSGKRRSRPLTPSSKPLDKCRSTAKKRRPAQAGAKAGGSKRHLCSPASTSKKRQKGLQEGRTAAKLVQKAAAGVASACKTAQHRTESTASTEDILRSVFSYRPKLRSLPPSPVASSSPKDSPNPLARLKWPEGLVLPDDLLLPGDLSSSATLSPVQARPSLNLDNVNGALAEASAALPAEKDTDTDGSLFEIPDPQLDLTANVDILGIIDRLDDTNVNESLYWSFHEIPAESLKEWKLHVWRLEADKAVFTYIKGSLKLVMKLGDYVKLPDTEDKLALARAACEGEVRRRVKHIASLRYEVMCKPNAQFNKYMLNRRLPEMHKTDELLKQYPTTDCLAKLLGEVGSFFARYWPINRDIFIIARRHHHAFEYPVLSVQIIASRRLIWFHLDLPIDIDLYPNAVIVPSMRPYSDEYGVISTEKLRRITARVNPGPKYLVRLVDEIENFVGK
ncbi:uncharacterized protein [Dermacentor andersoni]|uniref:uncharacterized protein n=1 Tax=Dermacentor andersoni TaxID=34620 RepID=UPI00215584C5|nr:uncharacterized protein LOC126544647 [Dermacentor andersoni]